MIADDPLHILIRHIRQRHIIPLQKGKPGIVIFKIQRLPHPLRHLVDKTENTFIVAGTVIIHQPVFKLDPQILVVLLVNFQQPFFIVRPADQYFNVLILRQVLIVKNIRDLLPAYLKQLIPRFHAHLLCNGALCDFADHMFCFMHSFLRSEAFYTELMQFVELNCSPCPDTWCFPAPVLFTV